MRRATIGLWSGFFAMLVLHASIVKGQERSLAELLREAGNAADETDRYRLLERVSSHPEVDDKLRADLNVVLPFVDRWANGREKYWKPNLSQRSAENGYLCDFLVKFLQQDDVLDKISQDSQLYPLWCLYLGRAMIHVPIQVGTFARDPAMRERLYGGGRKLLKVARSEFPENPIIGMYLDEPIPWPPLSPPDEQAPAWANAQREIIGKLTDIIRFWIEERQAEDGQFGGGWGDDVEMWRNWAPVLIGFEDEEINQAQQKLSEGLFSQPHMALGYSSITSDVEHSGEDSGDAGTAMMHVDPDNSLWSDRAVALTRLMESLWTGRNDRGQMQFKSAVFGSNEVITKKRVSCDTVYHPRAMQPALLYWQRTGDVQMTRLFSDWMDTWVDATARAERGKPAGIIPSAIHWPDGLCGGMGEQWWRPEITMKGDVYLWPSHLRMLTNTLLLTFHMTGDTKYLEPIKSMANIRNKGSHSTDSSIPGEAAWCAHQLRGVLAETLGKYRLLTGDSQFDDILLAEANSYVRFRITGQRQWIERELEESAQGFRYDRPAYTEEVRWTDRVFGFHSRYARYYRSQKLPRPDLDTLYSTITGDFGSPMYFPLNAVRWRTPPRDIAALVISHDTTHLRAELYHFGQESRRMGAEFFLLEPGDYQLLIRSVESAPGEYLNRFPFKVEAKRVSVGFTLPSRTASLIEVSQAAK